MKTVAWQRDRAIKRIRARIWRHLSAAAKAEPSIHLDAAALFQLNESDLRLLGELHFLLSDEVEALLTELPRLARRLATTTITEEEQSPERVRGAINWGRTLSARLSTGVPHMYVATPARRAYQTPENELLVSVLDSIADTGRRLGYPERRGVGREIADRVAHTEEFRRRRMLTDIQRVRVTPRSLARVRNGRHSRRYAPAIAAYNRFGRLVRELDPAAIREAIEERALVTRSDPTLFEIIGTFAVIDALKRSGWEVAPLKLFGEPRALRLDASRGEDRLELWYQHVPPALARDSSYVGVLRQHSFAHGSLQPQRPDLVLRHTLPSGERRWILGEVKLGMTRSVGGSARAALSDLLGYRRDFRAQLKDQSAPYGFGLAWGMELEPAESEVVLCTPDTLRSALDLLLDE